jgi:hypothetical protein
MRSTPTGFLVRRAEEAAVNGFTRLAALAALFACAAAADRALALRSGRGASPPAFRSTSSLCGQPVVPIAIAFGGPSPSAADCTGPSVAGVSVAWMGVQLPPSETGPCADLAPQDFEAIRCQFAGGYTGCVALGQALAAAPGSHVAEIRRGLRMRWSLDSDRRPGICAEEYTGNGSRLLLVPLTDALAGEDGVPVTGFATCFLVEPPPEGSFAPLVVERLVEPPTLAGAGTWGGWKRRYRL